MAIVLLQFLAVSKMLYLEFLDSRSCSFMEGFLRWILSTPRDLGGGVFGDIGREFVLCPGTARESLPVKKTQNKHNYNLEGDDICRILARSTSFLNEEKLSGPCKITYHQAFDNAES